MSETNLSESQGRSFNSARSFKTCTNIEFNYSKSMWTDGLFMYKWKNGKIKLVIFGRILKLSTQWNLINQSGLEIHYDSLITKLFFFQAFLVHLGYLFKSKQKISFKKSSKLVLNDNFVDKSISFESIFDLGKAYFKCLSKRTFGYGTFQGKFSIFSFNVTVSWVMQHNLCLYLLTLVFSSRRLLQSSEQFNSNWL